MLTLDCENSCRICLIESDKLSSIFANSLLHDERTLNEIIIEISGVQISEEDKLSKKICEECKLKALDLAAFRQLCIDSDETVRYNLLLEDQEESLVEECLENEMEVTQDTADEIIQHEDEDSFIDDSGNGMTDNDPEVYEVLHFEGDESLDEVKLEGTALEHNIILVKNDSEHSEDVTEKMRAVHFAKEQLKKHKCPYCDKTFMFPSKVNRHVVSVHKDLNQPKKVIKKNHCCTVCGKAFVSQFKVRRHMVVHDTELKSGLQKNWTRNYLLCPQCSRKFHTKATYDRHTIICEMLTKSDLSRPLDYDYTCVMCSETFKQHDEMVDHMKNLHHQEADQMLNCVLCCEFSGNVIDMTRHGRYHMENATYKCSECDKYFPNGDEIIAHLLRHANYRPFECTHEGCNKRFFDRYKLKSHQACHDPNIDKKKYICEECQRPFTHLDYLNCHIRRKHSKVKPYSCTFCSKTFAFHHDLNLHLSVHTGNKKHVCVICDASFTKAWSLKQHMVQHEVNPEQIKCPVCNFSTISKNQFNKHLVIHGNKICYFCEECNIEFNSEDELKFHMEETHQNQYPLDANSSDLYSLVEIQNNF